MAITYAPLDTLTGAPSLVVDCFRSLSAGSDRWIIALAPSQDDLGTDWVELLLDDGRRLRSRARLVPCSAEALEQWRETPHARRVAWRNLPTAVRNRAHNAIDQSLTREGHALDFTPPRYTPPTRSPRKDVS